MPVDKASDELIAEWDAILKDEGLSTSRGWRAELVYGDDPAGSHNNKGAAWGSGKWGSSRWGGFDYTLTSKRTDGRTTPDARLKCRERETGTTQSPETVAKRVAALTGKIRGPLSAERKAKISAAKLGKPQSVEHVAKRVAVLQGKKYNKQSKKGTTMPEVIEGTLSTPALSSEQKHQVLMLQRNILSTQVNITNLQKQLEQMGPTMNTLLSDIAKQLGINPEEYTFNLDDLTLVRKGLSASASN